MFVLKSSIEKLLQEAERRGYQLGYDQGCLDGFKNCENNQGELLKKVRELGFREGLTKSPFFEKKSWFRARNR